MICGVEGPAVVTVARLSPVFLVALARAQGVRWLAVERKEAFAQRFQDLEGFP